MSASQTEAMQEIKSWLLARRPELQDIPPDMDLIEHRVIDSLGFMEFVLFIESLTGFEIDAGVHSAESFRTLDAIRENIFNGGANE